MNTSIKELGKRIMDNGTRLAESVTEDRKAKGIFSQDAKEEELLFMWRVELFQQIGEALVKQSASLETTFLEWGRKAGRYAVKLSLSLEEALDSVRIYRERIWSFVEEEVKRANYDNNAVIEAVRRVDPLLDLVVHTFSITYVEHNNALLTVARQALEELSVPVVKLAHHIGVLPLIGVIDTHRCKLIMETTTSQCLELKVEHLYIDLSGVPIIDTMVAQNLFRVLASLQLLGIAVTLTGMRPELVQTVIALGIDFKHVSIEGTLHQALEKHRTFPGN
ncbi:positive regulator of sigma-B activity [Fictibacillus macauensis ZFHKF-1]|uniref:Positive regulator of sigma-B activity n=1 Tax=Fictibacillus macauensis ZFHKF-1 TaxID=1196324 RepID=I8UCA1_9BACL|nr:STAS domain-containing protein [Fictibacillus macauensis]EIT84530.1 positive regulator of sigma-B activity [Fictibacillus macauensis ZFHKF-1]